ncbi:hypothetical protein QJU96_07000 [Pasteurella skyensis]|uniref:Uncharacterized protein n=1 Tax=Phocoenobacter skyensis TaxID=97481 RepID=A0AAJ6ND59_9PAST|nr:hypothetical protein [Pasteurella skyensis]MDP8171033.1 hypothetical protein [Pasteurella skyensis]MDP8174643.1 hypothetical protein [Pasteurella skyensis]
MQKNTKQKNGTDKTIETFALSAAILTVIITIFPAILIFLVVVFFTGHFYLPSILNLIVSVLIIFAIRKKISQKLWLIPLFFAVSFLLTVNTRLPSIISDWIMPKSAMEISLKKLTLADKTKIKFTSNINLEYKYDPLEAVTTSGTIDSGIYLKEPAIIKEEIDKTLLQMGLILNDEADIEIKVVGKTDSYVTNVTATILENKKLIAQKEFRIRNRYFGDILRFENSPSGEGQKQSSYIAQDTFWQFFFKQARLQDNVVTNFIKQPGQNHT